ncbi:hypothetical protein PR048_012495 [Dryococelus australis]|uniref:Uncharacterized protein n=1 Tax=Dryococelus australis TaxID=614101 RepID=A0ABQ9HPQ2_9NEOP|nr:hypothetical protein PR048_012495 [Dryococelus australis]
MCGVRQDALATGSPVYSTVDGRFVITNLANDDDMVAFIFTDMHVFGEARGNAAGVVRIYQGCYPNRRVPDRRIIIRRDQQLHDAGSLIPLR